MCRVSWCNREDRFWKSGKPKSLCSVHIQYKNFCSAAANRLKEYLMYKVEKFALGKGQCEKCGFDPIKAYPNLHSKGQTSMLDVDHIISDHKFITEYENPNNFQLLCKHCHIEKGQLEGDNIRKDYR